MPCSQTLKGIPADCLYSSGGVLGVWFANFGDVVGKELTDEIITTITMAAEAKFKSYAFQKNTASFTSTLNVADNGSKYVSTELSMSFLRMDTAKRIELDALILSDLVAIVKDANGKYWFLGYEQPLVATGGSAQTGASRADDNNYQLTLTDEKNGFLYEVAASALADILD